MADNVTIADANDADVTVASDDVGGVQFQKVKIDVGGDGASSPWTGAVTLSAALPAGTNNIGDVDVLSVVPGTGATALGKAEDAAHASGDTGVAVLAVRRDSAAVGSGTDGDYSTLNVDASGRLWVNASGAAVPVTDNGGALTVDGSVSLAAALPAGTNNIGDVDVLSVVPGTGATNLGKAEDAAHTTGDVGVMALAVRKDSGATIAGTDGDYTPLQVDANGNLRVNIVAGGGSGGTSATDDAAFTPASGSGTPIMGFADETTPDAVDEGDVGVVRMTLARGLHVNLRDDAGDSVMDGANNAVRVNIVAGGGSGGTAMTDDSAFTPGSTSVTPIAGRFNDTTPDSVNEGDGGVVRMSANRNLYVTLRDAAGNERGLNVDGNGAIAVTLSEPISVDDNGGSLTVDGTVTAVGGAAHDAAVSGNPVLQGLEARTGDGTAVANGDAVRAAADTLGKQVVLPGAIPGLFDSGRVNLTNTTASDVLAAAGAGVKWVVTAVQVSNAHASVGTKVEIRDGTTVKQIMYAGAVGGGWVTAGGYPLFIGTANTAVTARCVTTGADVEVNISGYKISN